MREKFSRFRHFWIDKEFQFILDLSDFYDMVANNAVPPLVFVEGWSTISKILDKSRLPSYFLPLKTWCGRFTPMKLSLRISEAARRLGVCVKTLRRWNAQGKMSCVRTVGGHRRIPLSEIRRLLSGDLASASHSSPRVALYCRVSSYDQKRNGDLER